MRRCGEMRSPRQRIWKLQRRRTGWFLLEEHGARGVAIPYRIIGCPHEEGIDDEGPLCPDSGSAFYVGVDR